MTPNTYVCPIYLEPVSGTGERLAVGAMIGLDNAVEAKRIIRDENLEAMYGKKGSELAKLIDFGLGALSKISSPNLESVPGGVAGLIPGVPRHIYASSFQDAMRSCVLMYSSLGTLEMWDEDQEEDSQRGEQASQTFYTQVRDAVLLSRPNWRQYFNRKIPISSHGKPTKFGFINERSVMQFGVLSASNQSYGLRDAQAKLWQLARAREYTGIRNNVLIFAVPRLDDATLSDALRLSVRENIAEVEREADEHGLRFVHVHTVDQGASEVLERAA